MNRPGAGRKISFEMVLRIKALRDQGWSLVKIAEELSLSSRTVVKYVKILNDMKIEVKKLKT